MKLVHPNLQCQISFDEEGVCEWIIESPKLFAEYIQELQMQISGNEGHFVLSQEDKELDIAKYAEIILNPLSVDINDRKILNKIYGELANLAYQEDMFLSTQNALSALQMYFAELEQNSNFMLETDDEADIQAIFKALGVKVANYSENYWETLNQYVLLMAGLFKKKLLVLVNIRSYIDNQQLEQLVKNARYNEINLLLIENMQRDFAKGMVRYIIDCDGCEI